jgi:glucose/arabinose dehydrogenase
MPHVASGFRIERIASVDGARELAPAANGDLLVGTSGPDVYVVPHADENAGAPSVFAHFDNEPAAGVAIGENALFVGTQFAVYRVDYHAGDARARGTPVKLAGVRTSGRSRDHDTTTVAYAAGKVYASVGSSCNACKPDLDSTRATIQEIDLRTGKVVPLAEHIRNAIALAVDPSTAALWAGVAGVDDLAPGHPYEIFDDVTSHHAPVDYGWPSCYEDRRSSPNWPGSCADTPIPRIVFPAYETPIGAVFYPRTAHGRYTFPAQYRGGAFVTLHGSWHGPSNGLSGYVPPRVVFVPMRGDSPLRSVDWNDPNTQWRAFIDGYQNGATIERTGRPTGITVGPDGSLFVADDQTGAIYRIRPI